MSLCTLFFCFKIVLAILGSLNYHMELRVSLSVSAKKEQDGILKGIALNL